MNTLFLDLLVDKKDIMFINSIIESYEGIAVFRTIDSSIGHVQLMVPPAFVSEVNAVLVDLSKSLRIRLFDEKKARKNGFFL